MMFQKPSITILLACMASKRAVVAFTPSALTAATTKTAFHKVGASMPFASSSSSSIVPTTRSASGMSSIYTTTLRSEVDEAAEPISSTTTGGDAEVAAQEEDLNNVIYVVNLSYDTSFGAVKEEFSKFGTVEKIFMPKFKETGKFKGIAFITMSSEAERDAAIAALSGVEMNGRNLVVDKARPRGEKKRKYGRGDDSASSGLTKLYIGNISYDTDASQLEEYFGQYGEVSNVYVPTDRYSGEPRGFAFLAMKPDDAQRAIEESNGVEMNGRSIEVKLSLPKGVKAPSRKTETKLYIGNISFNTDEDELRSVFEEYGPVVDLYIPVDQATGRPRGFAFVTLEPENAERAVQELDGWELNGRMLRVNEAQPKGAGGGGYRGGRDSYGGDDDESSVNAW